MTSVNGVAAQPGPSATPLVITEKYRSFVLFMMTMVATLNFVDRQLMSILLEPIKGEFGLSDTQLGFLTGFAFAIFYSIMGIPLARIADNSDRRRLITIVIILWSIMTALCGATVGFATLLVARIGVAIGESGSAPAVQSMMSDYYPAARRSSAIGLQSTGVYIGILFGFLLGGWINEFFGWRTAFMVVGLPGILFAILFALTIKEPARGQSDSQVDTGKSPSLSATFSYLWGKTSYRYIALAMSLYGFVAYGSMVWGPSFFIRTHGMSTGEIGTWLALSAGVAGGLGCYFGGIASDYVVAKTKDERWYLWLPALFIMASIPLQFGIYLWPTPTPALLMSTAAWFLGNTWLGPSQSMIQGLAGLRMRAMALAIVLFINNLIGQGLGPQLVGILSDSMRATFEADSLRYALLISLIGATLMSATLFALAARTLRADLRAN